MRSYLSMVVLGAGALLAVGPTLTGCGKDDGGDRGGAGGGAGEGAETGGTGATDGTGGTAGEGPAGGAGGGGGIPGCVPGAEPDLPDDDYTDTNCDGIDGDAENAIFVAPSGDDGASGTMDDPVASITQGVALAVAEGKAVYVCNATYLESVTLEGDAVSIFGGYDCADGWSRSNARGSVTSPEPRALTIVDVAEPVTVSHLDFTAANAETPGASSIAGYVANSAAVTLNRVDFTAGDGAVGAPPAAPPAPTDGPLIARSGSDAPAALCTYPTSGAPSSCFARAAGGAVGEFGAGTRTCLYNDLAVWGGSGGPGANYEVDGSTTGGVGTPGTPDGAAVGEDGANGSDGSEGLPATSAFGSVTAAGYSPSNAGGEGRPGSVGQPGGGGRGGASNRYTNGVSYEYWWPGGGGGMGGTPGCGGPGGAGGGGGGASIALLVVSSEVTLSWSVLTSATGGEGAGGGLGGVGETGGPGGLGGLGGCQGTCTTRTRAPSGGRGGDGGTGGPGGPGAGGPSIALVYQGTAPTTSAVERSFGSGGLGAPAQGGTRAPQGLATEEYEAP